MSTNVSLLFLTLLKLTKLVLNFQDFGDYTEGYYSVQTQEADQIANLISGYVDIILKKVCGLFLRVCPIHTSLMLQLIVVKFFGCKSFSLRRNISLLQALFLR